jgi:hypothetical protein
MSLSTKFDELERLLLHHRHSLGRHSGVPFLILIYPPQQEQRSRAYQIDLREKLRLRGMRVLEQELNNFIFDHYREKGQLERIFELDRDPARRDELRRMLAGVYEKELVRRILDEVATVADADNTVVFLAGVASMYPFARVSNLLTDLENKIQIPLVVFYPGSEENGKLRFLNREPHLGYRARRI